MSSSILDRAFGLSKYFDFYEDNFNQERKCEETVNIFKEKLKEIKEPFFAWIHFFDPHSPYNPPEKFRKEFEDPYDGEIAYMDFCIGEIFKSSPENTIFFIIGDHGELLGEHGELEHGVLLYEGAIRVPFLIVDPEVKGERFKTPVDFYDFYKILYDHIISGKDLKKILNEIKEKPIISSSIYGREVFGFEDVRAVLFKGYKLIVYGKKRFKLFNLKDDKKEERDLSKEEKERVRELYKFLRNKKFPEEIRGAFPEEAEKVLKSLGYLMPEKKVKTLKDPEAGVLVEKKIKQAIEYSSFKNFEKAIEILKEVLREYPEHGEALSALGKIYLSAGNLKEGLSIFERLVNLRKNDLVTLLRYGQALSLNGFYEKAEKVFLICLEKNPRMKEAYGELAKIYSLKEKKDEVLKLYEKATSNQIEDFFLTLEMAKIKEKEKDYQGSFLFYHKAYKMDPLNQNVLLSLARVSILDGKPKIAKNYYLQILKINPNSFEANYRLGLLCYILDGNKEESKKYLSKAYYLCFKKDLCEKIKEKIILIDKNEKIEIKDLIENL